MTDTEKSNFITQAENQGLQPVASSTYIHLEYDTGSCNNNIPLLVASASELEDWVFSEEDALIIMHADRYSSAMMRMKVGRLLTLKGRDAVRDAVPALIYRYRKVQAIPLDQWTEGDGETILSLRSLLSRIGDVRSKDVLLEGMKSGSRVSEGLLLIGHSIVPAIMDSLFSDEPLMRTGAMNNLRRMAEGDPDFFTQQELSLIRTHLIESLGDEDGVVRRGTLRALEVFGDESVMPLLERIAAQDEYIHPFNGTYSNRIAAQKTIEAIRVRLQPELDLDKTNDE